jgi:hypothetical protein
MRFVTNRPRYTVGSPVQGFPAIQIALYADADCEVYLLEATGGKSMLLVGVRRQNWPEAPSIEQVRDWMTRHGCEVIGMPALTDGILDAVVQIHGAWMAEIPTQPMNESELYALLIALVDLGTDAAEAGLTAVPIRPLLWIEGPLDVQRLSSVYVRAGVDQEATVVRQIGQTFLWAATGISSVETESLPDQERFSSWCQSADAELARIVSRCIGSSAPIATLQELRRQIASSLANLAETRALIERATSRYISVSPYRYLWLGRP